jgi:hypothetical protein
MTFSLNVPSVHAIRTALEQISGAVRNEPLPERVQQGTDPASEIGRFDPAVLADSGSDMPPDYRELEGDECEVFDEPTIVFEVPPETTDAELKNVLGDGLGEELERLQQIHGVDALGWYVTFHQRQFQHGAYIPIEGVLFLAAGALSGLKVPATRRLELAFHAILRHEIYHFAVDCMAANWELAIGAEVYWKAKHHLRNGNQYIELEEALANAYMLRGFRHPTRALANSGGASPALTNYCLHQPAGYRDGPRYAASRLSYVNGSRELSARFQHASADGGKWAAPDAFDSFLLYTDPIRIDWTRCPIIISDRFGLLKSLGIRVSFFSAITDLVETQAFLKQLAKLDGRYQKQWAMRKRLLAQSVALKSLGFKKWPPDGPDAYSINVDGNYRAHLRHERQAGKWSAISIGPHKATGHG